MRRPLFFWTRAVLFSYAKLHVAPEDLHQVVSEAKGRIRNYPFKYYLACLIFFFLVEFIIPVFYGYFGRFSKLSHKNAISFFESFQNTKFIFGRMIVSLCKVPIMTSMKSSEQR